MRDDRDRGHRGADEAEREERDWPLVRAQVAERREERAGVEERRQNGHEDDVGRQRDVRQTRDEPEHDAAEDEQDRQWNPQGRREREQAPDGDEECE